MLPRAPEHLLEAVASLWSFLQERRPGYAQIRILDHAPWAEDRPVVEIVNDDMPFLVDSVTGALTELDLTVHHLIHPILPVTRDISGTLVALAGDAAESAMQIELAGSLDAEAKAAILREIAAALADVRAAVIDWAPMRRKVEEIAEALRDGTAPVPPAEIAETAEFLAWLTGDNFTFLGSRDYGLETGRLDVLHGTGKGLLRDDALLVFDGMRHAALPPDMQQFLHSAQLMPDLEIQPPLDRASPRAARRDRHQAFRPRRHGHRRASGRRPVHLDVVYAPARFDSADPAQGRAHRGAGRVRARRP